MIASCRPSAAARARLLLLAALPCLLVAAVPISIKDMVPYVSGKVAIRLSMGGRALRHGQSMMLEQVTKAPTVSFKGMAAGKLYTLMMVDPDVPSPSDRSLSPLLVSTQKAGCGVFQASTSRCCGARWLLPQPPAEHRAPWLTRAACMPCHRCRSTRARAALDGDQHPRPQQVQAQEQQRHRQGQRGLALP